MNRALRTLLDTLLLAAAAGLAALLFSLSPSPGGLEEMLSTRLPESGVEHPVTAVLLNFRGYDTLLEMLVLLLALAGVRGLGTLPRPAPAGPPSVVLEELLRWLTPLLVLVSAYLLWAGAHAPGGAFQAGAVLAAAGVLLLLTERSVEGSLPDSLLRGLAVLGTACFAAVGSALAVSHGAFLAYPASAAGALIFAIEAAATVSIAVILMMLFIGADTEGAGR